MTRYPYYERTIHYYETDRMGVVHHSNYARILEDCRIDMMAYYGLPYAELERMGYMIPVLEPEVWRSGKGSSRYLQG